MAQPPSGQPSKSLPPKNEWKILATLNKQAFECSDLYVKSMKDFCGPNAVERIVRTSSNFAEKSMDVIESKDSVAELERALAVETNEIDAACGALEILSGTRKELDKKLLIIRGAGVGKK